MRSCPLKSKINNILVLYNKQKYGKIFQTETIERENKLKGFTKEMQKLLTRAE